jgi:dTDP-4-amino-4,6-dideoxygalactose transaminase
MLVDSWKTVEEFERRMADYCGAPYAVAVDTCTAALFLCLKYRGLVGIDIARVPSKTYLGVACAVIHSGAKLILDDRPWIGSYPITFDSQPIVDSACWLVRRMYRKCSLTCLSFQYRKHLKIGRGGMVLTDDEGAADWLRKARFCGRPSHNAEPEFVGWHAYMEPERAARGLVLMDSLPDDNPDLVFDYPDLRNFDALKKSRGGL